MTNINPKIKFDKEKFQFGKDLNIEGIIILDGINITEIKSIQIEYSIKYGITNDDEKDSEKYEQSKIISVSSREVSLETLRFSIPIVYPNIKKGDGFSFDGYSSLIQNYIIINIKKDSLFSFPFHSEKITIPIEWDMIYQDEFNYNDLKNVINESKNENITVTQNNEITDTIILPWDFTDIVSKEYYDSILNKSIIAKFGDSLYRNPLLIGLDYFCGIVAVMGFVGILNSSKISDIYIGNYQLQELILIVFLVSICYLLVENLSKFLLRRSVNIDKFLPKISNKKGSELLSNKSIRIEDIFFPYLQESINPLTGIKGGLIITLSVDQIFTYQSGKTTVTHETNLIKAKIIEINFSSIEQLFSGNKTFPILDWVHQIVNANDFDKIGLKRNLNIGFFYDSIPDKVNTISIGK